MKLTVMIIAAAAILLGLFFQDVRFIIAGAVLHLLDGLADLCLTYRDAKLLRTGKLELGQERDNKARVSQWITGAITLTGLALVIVSQDNENSGYMVAGGIIWGGAIFCYFVGGIIAREVGGIPLSMGYGGWTVRRNRNRRYRR